VEPLTRGLPPADPRSLCPLSSTEFVEPPEKIPEYAIASILRIGFLNYHEGAGNNFLRNIRGYATIHTASYPRRL
jgi:hypothetical protein